MESRAQTKRTGVGANLRRVVTRPEYASLFILVVMLIVTAVLQKNFFHRTSLELTIDAFSPLVLLTMGQAVVMISGAFDLSTGAALSLYTCVLTYVMKTHDPITGLYAFVLTFLVAVLTGLINGIGTGYFRINSVVVTFATSFIWLGVALFIRPTPGGQSVNWFNAFYDFGSVKGMPAFLQSVGQYVPPVLVLVLIGCLIWYLVSRTKTGRYLYAVGGNEESAYRSGINTARIQVTAFVLNSVFIFLAALFFVGQNQSGDARFGGPFTLTTIAAAVVGGIALSGGRGSVYFAIVGALIINLVNKIIFFANISYAYGTLVAGLIVIVAIAGSQLYGSFGRGRMAKEKS